MSELQPLQQVHWTVLVLIFPPLWAPCHPLRGDMLGPEQPGPLGCGRMKPKLLEALVVF
jgi:hypothetical protein